MQSATSEGDPVSRSGSSHFSDSEVSRAGVRERILQATYECVALWGLAKTTVDDGARRAGLSRATVYRYFPGGREELLAAVISWEHGRFFTRLYEHVQTAQSLEEVMERGLRFAYRAICRHEVLQRVLETEPELLLPKLTVEAAGTQSAIADFLAPYLRHSRLTAGVREEEAADFLARMVLSYVASPGHWDLDDPGQVARLVRAELLAGILHRGGPGLHSSGAPGLTR